MSTYYYVSSGQTSTGIILNSADCMDVLNGGTANSTTVNPGGYLFVYSGGTAVATTVNDGGWMAVRSSSTATDTTVNDEGEMLVSKGGLAVSTTLASGGSLELEAGGSADHVVIGVNATLEVHGGGRATNVEWTPALGFIELYDGSEVTFTSQHSGVFLAGNGKLLSSGSVMTGKTVGANAAAAVISGGIASSFSVANGGVVDVYDGGTARGVKISAGGGLLIQPGGSATDVNWTPTVGWFEVREGGHIEFASSYSGVYYGSGGKLLSNTAVMTSKTLNNENCSMVVISGGTASSATVKNDASIWVLDGGTVIRTAVSSGGELDVEGGIARSTTVVGEDTEVRISRGGIAFDTVISSGGYMKAQVGGSAVNTVVGQSGHLKMKSGGTASGTTVNSGGGMTVNGGTANSTTVNSGGRMYLSSGMAASTAVNASGRIEIYDGGLATGTVLSGESFRVSDGDYEYKEYRYGEMIVLQGGSAVNTVLSSGGLLNVLSGGEINSTIVDNKAQVYVSEGGRANNTVMSRGLMELEGVASNITVSDYRNSFHILEGGKVTGTLTMGADAVVYAYEGSIIDFDISGLSVSAPARVNNLSVIQGTPDYTITVSANQAEGTYKLAEGAAGFDETVTICTTAGVCDTITVGETVTLEGRDYTLKSTGTLLSLSVQAPIPGAVKTFRWDESGEKILVSAADVMTGKTLARNGAEDTMEVYAGGIAANTQVNGGNLYVSSGGTASNTTLVSKCYLNVYSGGTARMTTINSKAFLFVEENGAVADSTTVRSGGKLYVCGGSATNIVAENGAHLNFTVAPDMYIQGTYKGSAFEMKDAVLSKFTVDSSSDLDVLSGGTVNSATINSSGGLWVQSGGKVTGTLTMASEAEVIFDQGGVIDFDISEQTTSAPARVNNLSLIQGMPDYTITVSANQTSGTYKLAEGAAGFDQSVTVYCDSTALGSLSVGETVTLGGQDYTLNLTDDLLSFTVGSVIPVVPGVSDDLNGDGRADIVMTITQSGHGAEGATGAWLIQQDQTAAWGDLSQRNEGWEIFGMGTTTSNKATNDVYVRSTGNVIGAWTTDESGHVAGWETVGEFSADTQVLGLGDFNGNGQTDLLLRNTNGAVGCFFTGGDVTGWNYFQSLGDEWKISAVGDLNGDGRADVVLKHDAGFAGSWLTQSDYTMAWADLDTLPGGFEIVGAGDFNGDGTDDVLLKNGNYYGAWIVQNGNAAGWMGLGDLGDVTVEQIADFDGDGKDDLRIRTAAGDLGAQLVHGADYLGWRYYGSVGAEWSTSLAAI